MKKPTILEKSFALLLAGVFLTFAIGLAILIFNHLTK